MEKNLSGELFSFPSTPSTHVGSDFEFESLSLTPDSPYKTSPADHLFSNGRLLPLPFPTTQPAPVIFGIIQDKINHNVNNVSNSLHRTGPSRTSSIGSKDSFTSSRSNSTSSNTSRSSVSSSARTSSSETSSSSSSSYNYYYGKEKRRSGCRQGGKSTSTAAGKTPVASKVVMGQLYGSSQRWQHIVLPGPALKRDDSRRSWSSAVSVNSKKESDHRPEKGKKGGGVLRRFFMAFLVVCRECHAMDDSPLTKHDDLIF